MMGADRKRFERPDPRAALEAEVVLLREENARLKRRRHEQHDVSDALARARSLRATPGGLSDESEQMLVQGLVIRESLIEICREIERAVVLFEARIDALAEAADQLVPVPARREEG